MKKRRKSANAFSADFFKDMLSANRNFRLAQSAKKIEARKQDATLAESLRGGSRLEQAFGNGDAVWQ
jgi:hypothetical protein